MGEWVENWLHYLRHVCVVVVLAIGCSTHVGNPDEEPKPVVDATPPPEGSQVGPQQNPDQINNAPKALALTVPGVVLATTSSSIAGDAVVQQNSTSEGEPSSYARSFKRALGTYAPAVNSFLELTLRAQALVIPPGIKPNEQSGHFECEQIASRGWSLLYAIFCGTAMAGLEKKIDRVFEFNLSEGSSGFGVKFGGKMPGGFQMPERSFVFNDKTKIFPLAVTAWRNPGQAVARTGLASFVASDSNTFSMYLQETPFGRSATYSYEQLSSVNGAGCSTAEPCKVVLLKFAERASKQGSGARQVIGADLKAQKLNSAAYGTVDTQEGVLVFNTAVEGFWQNRACVTSVYFRILATESVTWAQASPRFLESGCSLSDSERQNWVKTTFGDTENGVCLSVASGEQVPCAFAVQPIDARGLWSGAQQFTELNDPALLQRVFPEPPAEQSYRKAPGQELIRAQ